MRDDLGKIVLVIHHDDSSAGLSKENYGEKYHHTKLKFRSYPLVPLYIRLQFPHSPFADVKKGSG